MRTLWLLRPMRIRRVMPRRRGLRAMPPVMLPEMAPRPASGRGRGVARSLTVLTSLVLGGLTGPLACAGDSPLAPGTARLDAETGFWSLTVNHGAVTLSTVAPYDTIRLVATPRNGHGVPLAGAVLDSVMTTYTLANSQDTSVVVTPDGLMRARYVHDGSVVIVRTQVRGLMRADTIPVNVTDTASPPQAAALALSVTPDTITPAFGISSSGNVRAQVLDGGGVAIPHAALHFRSNPSGLMTVTVGRRVSVSATHKAPARPWLVAEGTVYGVTMRDSVPVTFTPPAFITLTAVFGTPRSLGSPVGHFEPAVDTLTLATHLFGDVGAQVRFVNKTATPIDVVWDDPAAVLGSNVTLAFCGAAPGGDIAAFVAPPPGDGDCDFLRQNFGEIRLLPTPGTYHYHSALYGTEGTIVVVPR